MKIAICIPARYASTRFPGKPLAIIAGQSMLSRVVDVAKEAAGDDNITIFVATEDQRIADHAAEIGVTCLMTSDQCPTGSDRALDAIAQLDDKPDFVINLQGDAPFTRPEILSSLIEAAKADASIEVVTPVHRLSWEDLDRLRENKKTTPFSGTTAIIGTSGNAMWFSKNIIPAIRKEERSEAKSPINQHLGIYGFRVDVLENFCSLPQGHYEQLEGLEQLRLLENNISIRCVAVEIPKGTIQSGIDSPEDLERAEALLLKAAS